MAVRRTCREITLSYNSDDPSETERAEWMAGQYRDILGVELVLEPIDGTTSTALHQGHRDLSAAC